MLRRRPTYEEVLKETMTRRLKILPERQKRTQQGLFIDDVDFDDFGLNRYDKKETLLNNPEKGTQMDLFGSRSSTEKSESIKSVEKENTQSEEAESEPTQEQEPDRETERERGKSMMRRFYDAMFGEDEFREEREELRNRREQIEDDDFERETPIEYQKSEESDNSLSMNVKKSYEPSSSSSSSRGSSTNRSALLPIEEEALSEHIQSSPPVSVQSSIPSDASLEASGRMSDRTIEYVEEPTPPQSVVSSRRSQETIEYIRSRSSASLRTNST